MPEGQAVASTLQELRTVGSSRVGSKDSPGSLDWRGRRRDVRPRRGEYRTEKGAPASHRWGPSCFSPRSSSVSSGRLHGRRQIDIGQIGIGIPQQQRISIDQRSTVSAGCAPRMARSRRHDEVGRLTPDVFHHRFRSRQITVNVGEHCHAHEGELGVRSRVIPWVGLVVGSAGALQWSAWGPRNSTKKPPLGPARSHRTSPFMVIDA